MTSPGRPRRVVMIVFPMVQTLDAAGPAEAFACANRVTGCRLYDVITASVGGEPVPTTAGFSISTVALSTVRPGPRDTVLVAGADEKAVAAAVAETKIAPWLRHAFPKVERLGSVCSGAFVLAAAGLLAGRRAATHWSACERLAALEPRAKIDRDAIFVADGRLWTSAGVTTGIDMALAMVEADHGSRVVGQIAGRLVLYARRPGFQSQWSNALVAQRDAADPLGSIIGWAREKLDAPLTVEVLARKAGMSPRTFHRRCLKSLGTTPARLVAKLRTERAKTLLATSRLSAKEIAAQCGLRDGAELTRLIRRGLGVGPREYRALFAAKRQA